ncbi:hypothetical protein BDY21DRAFT_391800 [Lineolata rhizophorae]|uniref:Complex I intermediate-associated protein-like protein 84 n=1 Tax=Lineolata rhizophorae TaxID=578093 RepID=A0A6A6P1N7_9PEZI|nr:hypothetical protein BDY21DRAFT_391800 [Lineolata rhizophorae]
MPSHLTRVIFRRILYNRPVISRRCLHRLSRPPNLTYALASSQLRASSLPIQQSQSQQQKRQLWFLPRRKSPPQPEEIADRALGVMTEAQHRWRNGLRAQPDDELAAAFTEFVNYKHKKRDGLPDVQAAVVVDTVKHLTQGRIVKDEDEGDEASKSEEKNTGFWGSKSTPKRPQPSILLQDDELHFARKALARKVPFARSEAHRELAYEFFKLFEGIREEKYQDPDMDATLQANNVFYLTAVLSRAGFAVEARDVVCQAMPKHRIAWMWSSIIEGLSHEGNLEELEKSIELLRQIHPATLESSELRDILVEFYGRRGDVARTKEWFSVPEAKDGQQQRGKRPSARAPKAALSCALATNELQWAQSIVKDIMDNPASLKEEWDLAYLWAARVGKSADELNHMISTVAGRRKSIRPNVRTINMLLEYALEKNDPYSAERYLELGRNWNIRPNATTYVLQMAYRLSTNDVAGALVAYKQLREYEPGQDEAFADEDIPVLNRLIQAMCAAPDRYPAESIFTIVEDLNKRKQTQRFEPKTVSALALLHLNREEYTDMIDLLRTHTRDFSGAQRTHVMRALEAYCLDPAHPLARVWDCYVILYQIFPALSRDSRLAIMRAFFTARPTPRADLALHVFSHMRAHPDAGVRADTAAYASVLAGVGAAGDEEALESVLAHMRLDAAVAPNTRLRNGLMLAHAGCGDARRALELWADVVRSREGPSYASIHIALRACEAEAPRAGVRAAREIWGTLRRMEVEVDAGLLASYAGVLAEHWEGKGGQDGWGAGRSWKVLCRRVEDRAADAGVEVDGVVASTLFNKASRNPDAQVEVERWMREYHPAAWDEMSRVGFKDTESGTKEVLIDRTVEP